MKTRIFTLLSLVVVLALFPVALSSAARTPLTFVEVEYNYIGTYQVASVALSPGGEHVYVAAAGGSLAALRRDPATGALTFIDIEEDNQAGVDGLWGAGTVVVSPDGGHIYVASFLDDALAVFSRDPSSGTLTFVEAIKDTDPGIDGLDAARSVAVSPDGKHVYAAANEDSAVAVFSRNPSSGALTFVEAIKDTDPGVDGLGGAFGVAVSPDGDHVYVASDADDAVAVFGRNTSSGVLTFVQMLKDEVGGVDGLNGARTVTLSPDGSHVYVAAASDDAVAAFSRNASSGELTFIGAHHDSDSGVDGLNGAWSVTVGPDGGHVYVAAYTGDTVAVFSRNPSSGALTFVEAVKDTDPGVDGLDGAMSVAISPGAGSHVYVAGRNDGAVGIFNRDATSGALTFSEVRQDARGLNGPGGLAVSPDGSHVYATGNNNDALVVFDRDGGTGAISFVEVLRDADHNGLSAARAVAVSPDGGHVYVAGHDDNAVAMFRRDASTGELTYLGHKRNGLMGVDGLGGTQWLTLSPDGNHLYAVGEADNAIAVFSRDPSSGVLDFEQVVKDTDVGVDGLVGAYSVAVSPDGGNVYVASYLDDALAVFSRNPASGALTFVEAVKDTDPGVDGLWGANSVAISPDGGHVYVASRKDDALAVFDRDGTSGALTYRGAIRNIDPGVDGLNGARTVVVSPNGDYVYVVSQYGDALACFSRNQTSGGLSFVQVIKDTDPGVDGLNTANGLAISPSGGHIYVAGYDDNAVAVFAHPFALYLPLIIRD